MEASVVGMAMQQLASRACAALMVLLMLTLAPVSPPRGCDRCPPDCPMHTTVVADDHDALPCHQGAIARRSGGDDAECVVRAACGHDGASLTGSVVRALLPDVRPVRRAVVARDVARSITSTPAAPPRQPPTAPPRVAVA